MYDDIGIVKESEVEKLEEKVEIEMKIGVDKRNEEKMVRGVVNMKKGNGSKVRVDVLESGEKDEEEKKDGEDIVGEEEMFEIVNGGKIELDR